MKENTPFPLLSAELIVESIAEPVGEAPVGIYDEVTQTMGGTDEVTPLMMCDPYGNPDT